MIFGLIIYMVTDEEDGLYSEPCSRKEEGAFGTSQMVLSITLRGVKLIEGALAAFPEL